MPKLRPEATDQVNNKKLKVQKLLVLHEYFSKNSHIFAIGRFDLAEQLYLGFQNGLP